LPAPGWKWIAGACAKCGEPRDKGTRCKPCRRKTLAAWYASNPQRQLDAKHRYIANHPERVAQQVREYKQRPETKLKAVIYFHKRTRKMSPGPNPWTEADYWRLYHIEQDARCAMCAKTFPLLTIDHIWPVFHGGSYDVKNIQLLCLSCNSSKGVKPMSGIAHKLVAAGAL
jgi:5-methylcytosine-specific restriction endonuclease McrA